MPSSSSAPNSTSTNTGKDFIAEFDSFRNEEEWSWTIIGAMARIQTQYAIERGIKENLPKDYFTDADRLKFFWSGFTNSTATKHIMDIIFRSIINWEIILLIFCMIFVQVFVFSKLDNLYFIDSLIFFGSYLSIVFYSIYITSHYRYFIFGDLSSRMMLALMIGRLAFLILSATILSSFLYWIANYFENDPKELYGWTSGIYWLFNLFDKAYDFFGSKEDFFLIVYKLVLPKINETSNEMLFVFVFFGVLPFFIMFLGKILRSMRISKEHRKFNKGE